MKLKAITSTTILPLDGVYEVKTIELTSAIQAEIARQRVPHYVGHPATKIIIEERLQAVPAESKLFPGLQSGESMLCVPIKQGRSDRSKGGTSINQEVSLEDLDFRIVTRLS